MVAVRVCELNTIKRLYSSVSSVYYVRLQRAGIHAATDAATGTKRRAMKNAPVYQQVYMLCTSRL